MFAKCDSFAMNLKVQVKMVVDLVRKLLNHELPAKNRIYSIFFFVSNDFEHCERAV